MKEPGGSGRIWQLYRMGGLTPAISSLFDSRNAQQMAFIRQLMKEQRAKSLYQIGLADLDAVVFDLETTGFSPRQGDEILSIGAVLVAGGTVRREQTFYTLTNPKREVPEQITALTGITGEMAAGAPELIDGLRQFLEFSGKRPLIAHGSGHDKQFLDAALWKTSRVKLGHRVLDTMMLAKLLLPGKAAYPLDEMLTCFGVGIGDRRRHHALDDALLAAELWGRMLTRLLERGVETLGELYERLSRMPS
ncbi:hypothetical protein J31TS4_12690 [Paenibacillus sp. J31TS4]|uniref:exonuclease domain-containing protein n=1 Tax=Paenibacillus sp. J31TS4 TaxID=2807195 RepID=UPI001B234884|nr:exonuclease domain-containing protein [Paenibacillus sp. J31TS4]GIP37989.1 hypothetical protein J31TS4_12690 [Paenibacillus sp. J31TS4]